MDCPHCSKGIDNIVSKDRFDSVYQERKTLKDQLTAATADLAGAAASTEASAALAARVAELETAAATSASALDTYKSITQHGITDPDMVDAVQWAHSRLPEENRPTLADALSGWKADPSTAPSLLRPHLSPVAVAVAPAPPPVPGAPVPAVAAPVTAPKANAGAVPYQGAPDPLSADAIAAMSVDAFKAAEAAGLI